MNGFNLSALAVRERAITMFFLVAIILGGIFAYQALGRAEDPPFTIKVFTVSAAWPGATAEEMQSLAADPLEIACRNCNGMIMRRPLPALA
jgi:multidrug efflux pump subunit AcrB